MKKTYPLRKYEGYITNFEPTGYGYREGTCAVMDCANSIEENSVSTWCKSCGTNPDAVLERLMIPPLEKEERKDPWLEGVMRRLDSRLGRERKQQLRKIPKTVAKK
jgi:hypothetical protein